CLNQQGEVAGYYYVAGYYFYSAFLREPDGQITSFAVPPPGPEAGSGTFGRSINRAGVVASNFERDPKLQGRGLLRYPDGTILDLPKSGFRTEIPHSINSSGDVTGIAIDKKGAYHGFASSASGALVVFDAPDSVKDRKSAGTFPTAINFQRIVAGYYTDARGLNHGFEWTP
ncbi:MAG: hypothetical protein IAI50_06915, partial [Candidatus Eremiobacteraeota bacterium]|nr:hypothetical protein [Candidatus Eremiobacteraeota bacterium]